MKVTIRLFGNEARLAGKRELQLDVTEEAMSASDLKTLIEEHFSQLAGQLEGCRVAVDQAFVGDEEMVDLNAELALIGAVSGG